MYKGKRMNPKRSAGAKRKLALLVSLVLVLSVCIGATVAYLIDDTDEVENVFTPAEVPPTIEETFPSDRLVKSDVKVTNGGNISAYIRAAIVVTWQKVDEDGKLTGDIASEVPVLDTDYSMNIAANTGWTYCEEDGFYYYKDAVEPYDDESTENIDEDSTGVLISKAEQLTTNGDYKLVVEILAQTIQAQPSSVVAAKWGVTVNNDGTISKEVK